MKTLTCDQLALNKLTAYGLFRPSGLDPARVFRVTRTIYIDAETRAVLDGTERYPFVHAEINYK